MRETHIVFERQRWRPDMVKLVALMLHHDGQVEFGGQRWLALLDEAEPDYDALDIPVSALPGDDYNEVSVNRALMLGIVGQDGLTVAAAHLHEARSRLAGAGCIGYETGNDRVVFHLFRFPYAKPGDRTRFRFPPDAPGRED